MDTKGVTTRSMARAAPVEAISSQLYKLRNRQRKQSRRKHQSVHKRGKKRGRCKWEKCPDIAQLIAEGAKRGQASTTVMHCEECSAQLGKTIYLCNSNNNGGRSICHIKYHNKFHCKKYLDKQEALKKKEIYADNNLL